MKKSAAVPSGALAKRRLRNLTKLMAIIFARYLASLTVYVASSQSAPFIHALLCRSTRRVMSSSASDACRAVAEMDRLAAAGRCCSGRRVACASSCSGTRVACVHWRIAADTAAGTGERLDAARRLQRYVRSSFSDRTPQSLLFESLAVASHPLQLW